MRRELVLSGKKEALKHVGRVNKVIVKEVKKIVRLWSTNYVQDTLDKLKKLAGDEESQALEGLPYFEDDGNIIDVLVDSELDTIEPSLSINLDQSLLLGDPGALFISRHGVNIWPTIQKISTIWTIQIQILIQF